MDIGMIIPKRIKVGYQSRGDTFTGKLAYVIYYDEKGELRKRHSWESWIDSSIPTDEFNNEPIAGFGINKKAGGYSTGWNHRQSYIRVYDPRGFEVEITVENLIYLIENTSYHKSKGFEDKLVYCWSGKDLVLIPVSSPDYTEIVEYNKLLHSKEKVSAKKLVVGGTYKTKQNEDFVYLGYFEQWETHWVNDLVYTGGVEPNKKSKGKKHFFGKIKQYINSTNYIELKLTKSPTSMFIATVSQDVSEDLPELQELLNKEQTYSPVDFDNIQYIKYSKDELLDLITTERWNFTAHITYTELGITNQKARLGIKRNARDAEGESQIVGLKCYKRDINGYNTHYKNYEVSLDKLINEIDVYYAEVYLKNGVKHKDTKHIVRN